MGHAEDAWIVAWSAKGLAILLSCLALLGMSGLSQAAQEEPELLDPLLIPKWVNQLDGPPPVYVPEARGGPGGQRTLTYEVDVTGFYQQILPPPLPMTFVWGYGGQARDAITGADLGYVRNAPGPSFEATRHTPIQVTWTNRIDTPHLFPVDPTLHWANPNNMEMPMPPFEPWPPGYEEAQYPVPMVPHLHGGEVPSQFDGNPDAWFTYDGMHGSAYSTAKPTKPGSAVYWYPNDQPATTLWYHDHALGITRLNVLSGLAGFYLLRDPEDPIALLLPQGRYEVPLVIQDRIFRTDGSLYFPAQSDNPDEHPYWMPEFFGNTIMVNGKVWPNMNVSRGQYRLRLLDGSNARFYTLSFQVQGAGSPSRLPFIQIGSDGGYLRAPVTLERLTLAPGERADILVDFSSLQPGTKVLLTNSAKAPFPNDAPPDPRTVGQIMQFTVTEGTGPKPANLPPILNPTLDPFPSLPPPSKRRILTLFEVMGPGGPLALLLNGQRWSADVSEIPLLGSTEEWVLVNPTADTHPIHLHLVQFQLVSRQSMDTRAYVREWMRLNGMPPVPNDWSVIEVPIEPYLRGKPTYAEPNEQGWKDTIQVHPGEVTILRVRFAPIDGSGEYPFDATKGPGYVWHCHILDHEDNEMMRPYHLVRPKGSQRP